MNFYTQGDAGSPYLADISEGAASSLRIVTSSELVHVRIYEIGGDPTTLKVGGVDLQGAGYQQRPQSELLRFTVGPAQDVRVPLEAVNVDTGWCQVDVGPNAPADTSSHWGHGTVAFVARCEALPAPVVVVTTTTAPVVVVTTTTAPVVVTTSTPAPVATTTPGVVATTTVALPSTVPVLAVTGLDGSTALMGLALLVTGIACRVRGGRLARR